MSELACLKLSFVLWLVHVIVQAAFGNALLPAGYLFTPRDQPAPAKGVMFGRATRALANYVENLGPFLALDLGLMVTGQSGGFGPTLWILARAIYIPIYVLGVVYARTAIWAISVVALLVMFFKLPF